MNVQEIVKVAEQAGFSGEGLYMAACIALAESGGNPNATNTVGNSAGTDRGLWQINSYYHSEVSDECAFNPQCCASAAFRISNGGWNWEPWSTYNNGAWRQYWNEVVTAAGYEDANERRPAQGGGKFYKIQPGDTLSAISQRFYGSWTQWGRIHAANPKKTANPNMIHAGDVLWIPR